MTNLQRAAEVSAALSLFGALVFGGASQGNAWPLAAAELLSLPGLAIGLGLTMLRWSPALRWPVVLLVAIISIPLLQLVPLPASIWTILPGRPQIVQALSVAGIAPIAQPWSLTPGATFHSLLALSPAIAVFLITPHLTLPGRIRLVVLTLGVAMTGVVLGIAQVAGGPESPLRFYSQTNLTSGVGFFSNRNHQAGALACMIPLAAAWASGGERHDRAVDRLLNRIALALGAVFIVGVAVSGSRAGVLLAIAAVIGGFALRGRSEFSNRVPVLLGLGAAALVLMLAAQAGQFPVLERFSHEPALDLRWQAAPLVVSAARTYFPFGSGIGSFIPIYQTVEQPWILGAEIFNHAHDDYLEITLEAGLAAWIIFAGFMAWWLRLSLSIWRSRAGDAMTKLSCAGSVVATLLLVHSAVDYPLRTVALETLFAFALGLMVRLPRGNGKTTPALYTAPAVRP